MPKVARVQLPDGRIARFEVPDDATPAQVEAAARNLSRQQPKAEPKRDGPLNWIADNVLSPLNEAIIGVPEGIYNAAAAVTDPIAKLIVGDEAVEQAQGQRRKVADAATKAVVSKRAPVARTAGRIGGSLAIPTPKLNMLGKLAPVAQRAVQGAAGGAAVREVDEGAAVPAAIGAITNVALPPVLRMIAATRPAQAIAAGAQKLAAPVTNFLGSTADDAMALLGRQDTPYPSLPPAVVAARQAETRPLAPLGRKAEARAARFKASGADEPTTGMVTRDPNTFAFERNTAPIQDVGDDLQRQILAVEQSLVAKGRELVGKQGGSKGAEATGDAVQKALDAKRGEMQQVTSRLYDKVREERGTESVGRLEKFLDAFDQPDLVDDADFETMRRSILNRLRRYGDTNAKQYADAFGRAPAAARQAKPGSSIKDLPVPEVPDEIAVLETRRFPTAGGARFQYQRGPVDLVGFLRSKGGIQDQGGELRHLGIDNARRNLDFTSAEGFLGGLVKPNGMTLDDAALQAWEAGYFPNHATRPGIDDFLDALRETHAGRSRRFLPDDMEELARFEAARDARYAIEANSANAERLGQPAGPDDFQSIPAASYDAAPSYTVQQAEELRKFIGQLGGPGPNARRMRAKLIDALDDDVVDAVGDDAFKAARASAKARFDEFSRTFAGRIADEGIAPERLTKRVLSETTSLADLRAMRQSLLSGTDEQAARGKEAWQGLRAQALEDLLSRSMNEEGKLLGGQLARDFTKQSAKFRELLDPADYKELRRLVLASRDATVAPPGSAVNYSGTAPALANLFQATKPKVREGWLKFFAKHLAAGAVSFPAGNVAVEVGTRAAASAAQQKAANALFRRVELARSPEATAKAIAALREAAKKNPAAANLLDQVTGPTVAAMADQ